VKVTKNNSTLSMSLVLYELRRQRCSHAYIILALETACQQFSIADYNNSVFLALPPQGGKRSSDIQF
jgi:hypothetical protein